MNISLNQMHLLFNIYSGILKPVNKLIDKHELQEILDNYTFNDEIYSLPYLFFVPEDTSENTISFMYNNEIVAVVYVESYYHVDPIEYTTKVFKTNSLDHPGVKNFFDLCENSKVMSGYILHFNDKYIDDIMKPKKFNKNYVFQSRNPPHKIHESIVQKFAPDILYSTPFETNNPSDYSFDLKLKTYIKIKEKYNTGLFISTLPRVFAGPREALQNLLIFKNLGINNFIMGRGKNCIGNFYSDTESYDFCKLYTDKIKVNIVYQDDIKINGKKVKGTTIREDYIQKGIYPPEDFMSKEIAEILING